MTRPFLRVRGDLWTDGTYHPSPGWETQRLARPSRSDSDLTLAVVDASGDAIARGPIHRREKLCVDRELRSTDSERVFGHVVLHPRTAQLVVSLDHQPIFTTEVCTNPPRIHRLTVEPEDGERWLVEWAADHEKPLTFNLLYIDPLRRVVPIAQGLRDTRFQLDTTDLPGGGDAAVGLIATDGTRSASVRSEFFAVPIHRVELCMIAPDGVTTAYPGHPLSLIGSARDLAGRTLPDAGISWLVDDESVASGTTLACAQLTEFGDHTITMIYQIDDQPVARLQRSIRVAPPGSEAAHPGTTSRT
jgi:hypothetical protein